MTVTLKVNNKDFTGWTAVSVRQSMEAAASSFSLGVAGEWPSNTGSKNNQVLSQIQSINKGDLCGILLEGETLSTGFIDSANPSYDAGSHSIAISRRDATGDLVDCSADPGQWLNQKLESIAADICKPFGIRVLKNVDTGQVFNTFKINEGETAFAAIERLCRMRAVLIMPDGKGSLILTRAGTARASVSLERGVNILSASGQSSDLNRYSHYTVKGQQQGHSGISSEEVAGSIGQYRDKAIKRYRPLVLQAEQSTNNISANDRAAWEANVRAARGLKITIKVQGWREKPDGQIWRPNRLVHMKCNWLGVNHDLLISAVNWTYSEAGKISTLTLVPKGAFSLLPVAEKGA